jgi:hypothetical protein
VWASGDYYQKKIFKNVVFPSCLVYDTKIENYRTPVINKMIGCIAYLSKGLGKIKKLDFSNFEKKSSDVLQGRT